MTNQQKRIEHTPGPWEYEPEGQYVHLPDNHARIIADIRGWGWLQKLPNGAEIQDANGRLIASAPELKAKVESQSKEIEELKAWKEEAIKNWQSGLTGGLKQELTRLRSLNEAAEKVIESYREQPQFSYLDKWQYTQWEKEHKIIVDAYESLKK